MQDGKQDGVVVESCFANFSLKRAVEVFGKAFLDSGRIFNRILGVTAEYPATSKRCLRNGGYAATRLNGCVAKVNARLNGYVAKWLRSYMATQLFG